MRLLLPLLLALAACEGGGKTTDSSATDTAASTTDTPGTDSAGTTTAGSGSSSTTTSGHPTTEGPTTGPSVCADLSPEQCAAAEGCADIFGKPLDFPGCTPEPTFLFCNEEVPCDAVILTVCKNDTGEAFQLFNGCIPPGFSPCESDLGPCGSACFGLDEQACLADPLCQAHFGAPHTTTMGMACSDFQNPVFLACDIAGPPCPPAIVTACPEDQPDTAFDLASGCLPPGFVHCMEPLPECP